jgi:hypothetical protein
MAMTKARLRPYFLTLALGLPACLVLLWVVVSVLIDPYGEFHILPMRRSFERHETTPYYQAGLLERDSYALVFGSSRSATLNDKLLGEPVLNLSTSLYDYPTGPEFFLRGLDAAQWSHIRRIYFLDEYHMLPANPWPARPASWTSRPAFLWQTFRNMDSLKILRAVDTVVKTLGHGGSSEIGPHGETIYLGSKAWDGGEGARPPYHFDQPEEDAMAGMLALAKEHHVPFLAFRSVVSDVFWKGEDFAGLKKSLHLITAHTPLLMLAWEPKLSRQHSSFRDFTHHEMDITAWEAKRLTNPALQKGLLLREKDVDAYVARVQRELKTKN